MLRPAFAQALSSKRAHTGDIQPLNDLTAVRNFIGSKGLTTLFDLPFGPLFLGMLYFIHPVLFGTTLFGIILLLSIVALNQAATRRSGKYALEKSTQSNLLAQAFVRNADTLRSMGMTRNAIENWGFQFTQALQANCRTTAINACFGGFSRSVRMILQLAILGTGAWLVLQGKMTAGMIFASSIISGRALQPLDMLIGGWRQTVDAFSAMTRLQGMLYKHNASSRRKTSLPQPSGAIQAQDLSFFAPLAKPGSDPIIKRVNFRIESGESVALIGPSRAGKSTLLRLLVGATDGYEGSVLYDFAEISTWDREQLGRHVGYLAQEVQLFPGTIAQNIARFEPDADDERIIEAARKAHAHEMVAALAEGYQTRIGLTGYALSGGERQRIGLARAFYGNPTILMLDEPNANLDYEGEIALEKALQEAKARRTTIIIVTHRLSIAGKCDRVMMLRNGKIDAFGPSAEILQMLSGENSGLPISTIQDMQTSYAASGSFRQFGEAPRANG